VQCVASHDFCPVCDRCIKVRLRPETDDSGDIVGVRVRSEKVRRWDHMRKMHKMATCDGCRMWLPKADMRRHMAVDCPGLQIEH
jgi:hypothetical protein